MRLSFLGANRQVTGSCYVLEAGGTRVMIDHGLFQERDFQWRNWENTPVPVDTLDALIMTHAHIDHSGRVPKLMREGLKCDIFATEPTVALLDIMLHDSARIQAEDARYKEKRHRKEGRKGKYPPRPLYEPDDVIAAMKRTRGVAYREPIEIRDNITVTFHDAGHILGSAMLEIELRDGDDRATIIFSGDIGQHDKPFIDDPTTFDRADYIVMESTYGDRDHKVHDGIEEQLEAVINRTIQRGGSVVVPTFAVERAQELIWHIGRLAYDDRIPDVPVFLDSPMAVDVTETFRRHRDWFDESTASMLESGRPPLQFPGLKMSRTVEQSKQINALESPAVILATSGMCTAGRIKHHLKRHITRPESTILFVGYQGRGTLGRHISDGNREVRIHGRWWPVRAEIDRIDGFSAHADRAGLLGWLDHFERPPKHLFLTHGEEEAALALADEIEAGMNWRVHVPAYRDSVTLDD